MYITLLNVSNGEPVPLVKTLSADTEVALCELTYYHRWYNISAELGNNRISNGVNTTVIRDGYYNDCELNEKVFQPLGAELQLLAPTGRLQLSVAKQQKRLTLHDRLAKLLGFARSTFEPGKTYIAAEPPGLAIHREICVHLSEVSTSDNLQNGRPSTLLRAVPVENERCGSGRTEAFPVLQFKRLGSGPISQLTLSLKDTSGKELDFDYISATLHLRSK